MPDDQAEVHGLRLVRDADWPPDRFETWLGETFIQLWLP